MKVLERPDTDPARIAFFMPTAEGPCRFGQYAPYLRQMLDANGYRERGDPLAHQPERLRRPGRAGQALRAHRLARAAVRRHAAEAAADPPAVRRAARAIPRRSTKSRLDDLCRTLEETPAEPGVQLAALRDSMVRAATASASWARRRDRRMPLIGIVGEIFCRLNTFSNENLVRAPGRSTAPRPGSPTSSNGSGTPTPSTSASSSSTGRIWTLEALGAWVRKRVQKRDEHVLMEPFRGGFRGPRRAGHLRDPGMRAPLPAARRRLRRDGAERGQGRLPGAEGRRRASSTSARSPA